LVRGDTFVHHPTVQSATPAWGKLGGENMVGTPGAATWLRLDACLADATPL
jgi:hypothetical protein